MTDPKEDLLKRKAEAKALKAKRAQGKEAAASFSANISMLTTRLSVDCSFGHEKKDLVLPTAQKVQVKRPFWFQDPIQKSDDERLGVRMHFNTNSL